MKILLIGATGQIGYSLMQQLAASEHQVAILVRSLHGLEFPDGVTVLQRPTFNSAAFSDALNGIDQAIYAVGIPEQFVFDEDVFRRVNVDLLRVFLEQLPDHLRGLTYLSTFEVFAVRDGVIRESHHLANAHPMTPYYQSMLAAYQLVKASADQRQIPLTTTHPAAVYGGRNTGRGFTAYVENLRHRRFWQVPFVFAGSFPVVHVKSLADAVLRSLGSSGPFIISDQMTSLREIAETLRHYASSYVPLMAPQWVARAGTSLLEALAHLTRRPPPMAHVQIDYITGSERPATDRAQDLLGWQPMSLEAGIQDYLSEHYGT